MNRILLIVILSCSIIACSKVSKTETKLSVDQLFYDKLVLHDSPLDGLGRANGIKFVKTAGPNLEITLELNMSNDSLGFVHCSVQYPNLGKTLTEMNRYIPMRYIGDRNRSLLLLNRIDSILPHKTLKLATNKRELVNIFYYDNAEVIKMESSIDEIHSELCFKETWDFAISLCKEGDLLIPFDYDKESSSPLSFVWFSDLFQCELEGRPVNEFSCTSVQDSLSLR